MKPTKEQMKAKAIELMEKLENAYWRDESDSDN